MMYFGRQIAFSRVLEGSRLKSIFPVLVGEGTDDRSRTTRVDTQSVGWETLTSCPVAL